MQVVNSTSVSTSTISLDAYRLRALKDLNEKLDWLRRQRDDLYVHLDRLAYLEQWSFDHVPVFEPFAVDVLVGAMQALLPEFEFNDVLKAARGHQRAKQAGIAEAPEGELALVLQRRSDITRFVDTLVEDATIAVSDATTATFTSPPRHHPEQA